MHRVPLVALLSALLAGCAVDTPPPPARPQPLVKSLPHEETKPQGGASNLPPPSERVEVPGFEGATAWLNVNHPITKEELKGRVVVVDFWTSCCINCIQTFPTLKRVEARFHGKPVTVIGVHAPKFDEEKGVERLREFLRDNGLEHPIAVDSDMHIWRAWGVTGWPTVAVLDVDGRAAWAAGGEPDASALELAIQSALDEGAARHVLATTELRGVGVKEGVDGPLLYPGKVLALRKGGLAVADTGHHRVVLLDASAHITAVAGSGLAGTLDGDLGSASFMRPEGLAELDGALYVADPEGQTIRKIDLEKKTVTTVAGTRELGMRPLRGLTTPALETALRSPWDLLPGEGVLYVALAGSHQVGLLDPVHGTIRALAGNGREARVDGALGEASFAQPSALATDGKELFVLDSETSSVRAIDVPHGVVRTVVGEDLFEFGDVDGDKAHARFEHPLGLAYTQGSLWVADTFNAKLRRVDPRTGATTSVLGGRDRTILSEPSGLAATPRSLFVADTDHHRVLMLKLPFAPGSAPTPLAIQGLSAPARGVSLAQVPSGLTMDPRDPVATLGPLRVTPGAATRVRVHWAAPAGTAVNEAAPFRVAWVNASGLSRAPDAIQGKGASAKDGFDFSVEPSQNVTSASLSGVLDLVVCDVVTHAACVPVRRTIQASFDVREGTPSVDATLALPSAR